MRVRSVQRTSITPNPFPIDDVGRSPAERLEGEVLRRPLPFFPSWLNSERTRGRPAITRAYA